MEILIIKTIKDIPKVLNFGQNFVLDIYSNDPQDYLDNEKGILELENSLINEIEKRKIL